jgi:crossover junction endodeoxyribonuclease RuvC
MGIDPGLNCTGYGVVDRLADGRCRLVEAGAVRTAASASLETRLRALYDGVCEALDDLEPQVVIVESLYSKYRHPRTAILMGHARGVIYLAAQERGLAVEAYPASQVKRALTGAGRAAKQQVAEMVCRMLSLPEAPRPYDVTDALALALCHANPQRFGGDKRLPAAVREAEGRSRVGEMTVSSGRVEPHPLAPSPGRGGGVDAASGTGVLPVLASRSLATRDSRLATTGRGVVRP